MSAEKDREPVSAVPTPAAMPAGAVFLSYASEDAQAAERIASALRSAGIEVWFDKSELRGGDAWDRRIREQIQECRLFIAVISAHTEARDEGYFRREWSLAADRTRDMAHRRAFLIPVVIDETPERGASVPEKFHDIQWTRLSGGDTPTSFVEQIQRLLMPDAATRAAAGPPPSGSTVVRASKRSLHPNWPSNAVLWVISALVAAGLGYLIAESFWRPQHSQASTASQKTTSSTSTGASTVAAFNPPPHSIAVLPFVNMSGDKEQEYFSDGLSEELLNDLARINELQVAARTSAFSFKGKDTDIGTVARKLNVAAVLEGSVRRSRHRVRITAQLINAVSGYHLWSETYDRDLGDVLKLQTEIASAVASALRVTLLRDVATEMRVGGTRNPAAYDAYLRSTSAYWRAGSASDLESVIAGYAEALRLDPNFALAHADLAIALHARGDLAHGTAAADFYRQAQAPAFKAVALAPELAEGHLALFIVHRTSLDLARANEEIERAMALAPGNARVLRNYSPFALSMGHSDEGITAARRAAALDPLSVESYAFLSDVLVYARRYDEALAAYQEGLSLPHDPTWPAAGGWIYYALGDFEKMRAVCEGVGEAAEGSAAKEVPDCLALAYHKLGRQADAESALARFKAVEGDTGAYDYATIYAQWGNTPQALEWLETALRLRDPQLISLKTDPLLDPLRHEPRFQAIERALKFPG